MQGDKQPHLNFREKFRLTKEGITDIVMFVLLATAIILLAMVL